ncbi:MAG TPA: alpha/beta hydrolase [Gaiella sp.]
MPSFDERHLAVRDVDTAVLMAGDGDPLVFFHGGGVIEGFDCFLPLAERFRFVVPFHPGFGASDDDPAVAGIDDWVARYVELFDQLGLERVVLFGHSLGGWLAARFTIAHPERVRRLVLASPAMMNVPEHPPANLGEMSPEQIYAALTKDPAVFAGRIPQPLDDAFVGARMREAQSVGRVVPGPFDPVLEERLGSVRAPTLLLWGEDDQIVPVGHAPAWAERIPEIETRVFPGRGHLLFHEDPEAVAAVLEFASD